MALSVLSALKRRELERAIVLGDKAVVGRAQGVGPKLAQRIVTELKDKAPAIAAAAPCGDGASDAAPIQAPRPVESRRDLGPGEARLLADDRGGSGGARRPDIGRNAAKPCRSMCSSRESLRQLAQTE